MINTCPFNAQIRTEKKLLGIMRFSEHLKIAVFQGFFREIGLEFANSACLRRIDGSF